MDLRYATSASTPCGDLYFCVQDFILVAEGTRIAIQNMTWNGAQGFQTPIEPETFSVKNMGVYGNEHTERGLTCALHCIWTTCRNC
jgi:hypothetical protein